MGKTVIRAAPADAASGVLVMGAAMLIVPIVDAIAKHLSASMPSLQIAWFRFAIILAVLAPVMAWRGGWRAFFPPRMGLHALRGAGIAGATALFFAALAVMPMADVAAIFFVEPLILTVFCAIFLGEPIGWRRIVAVAVGFGGAMLVIRPSFVEVGPAALLPLGAALCFAGYFTITKLLVKDSDPWTLQGMAALWGAATLGALALASGEARAFQAPEPLEWALLLGIGAVAVLCHTLIIFAVQRAPAATLAPLQYLEIIGATIYGYLFFRDFPDALTWLGIAIIVGSGVFVFHREHTARREPG